MKLTERQCLLAYFSLLKFVFSAGSIASCFLSISVYFSGFVLFCFEFWLHHVACRALVPLSGIELVPPTLEGGIPTIGPMEEVLLPL